MSCTGSLVKSVKVSVTAYFKYLKRWNDLAIYTSLTNIIGMTPATNATIHKREEKQQVHQFLISAI
ncbi:hypothetical protein FRX31_030071 [Thalictrum thalictroides]|uniref:Uncharacterized protein n=1 Tax=Thalictrum thalictroides TaxID=46969 RepID=A0A7J6V601_THATH|nr:hypothetical protein FRX31_030071 [Thalictrum thalictroides]